MERFALALGVLASLIQLAGYWQYNVVMKNDPDHDPNAPSWFMWTIGAGVEFFIFGVLVDNWSKEFLPLACTLGMLITFVHMWWRHGLRIRWKDWRTISLDAIVVLVWAITKDPYIANVALGIDIAISFSPILKSVKENPRSENPQPWRTWSVAYALLFLTVILQWQNWYELIYPGLYLVFHVRVWRLSASAQV